MPTALVVDDSATDRRLVGGLLEKSPDWSVVYASDGAQALIELDLIEVDVVVTDLVMPRMNGRELVETIKKRDPLIPVVLITGKGSEQIAVKALEFGAASYLPKRRLSQDLLTTVNRVLAAARVGHSEARLMQRMIKSESNFVLDNDLSMYSYVLNYLQQMSSMLFTDANDRVRVAIAVEEALLNAYYHGILEVRSELREEDEQAYHKLVERRLNESPFCDRKVYIEAKISPAEAVFVVRDEGPGFDPSKIPDPLDPENVIKLFGRGCFLMQVYMDQVTYNDTGNEVTLVKRRVEETSATSDSNAARQEQQTA